MSTERILILTLMTSGVCLGGEPVNYWNVTRFGDVWAEGSLKLDDGSTAAWTNGNWLIAGSSGYPSAIGAGDYRNLAIGSDVSAHGVKYKSGGGRWEGSGVLSIGAGGYDASLSWDESHTFKMAGVRLEASQRWYHPCGVVVACPVSAAAGAVWTLTSDQSGGQGRNGIRFESASDLTGVTVVLQNRERLSLMTTEATLKADVLRLEGANVKLYYKEASGNTLDRRYAKALELADGAVAAFTVVESTDNMQSDYRTCLTNTVYDLDAIRVVSGSVTLGDGYAYAVKDGATLPVDVAEGATLTVATAPTDGRLSVTGAGALVLSSDLLPFIDMTAFGGTVRLRLTGRVASLAATFGTSDLVLADSVVRIDDVSGYAGTLTLTGTTRVALPRTADWPEGLKVVASDEAVVYLPAGEAVDETRISGEYRAVGRGYAAEEPSVTVASGEELVVCGDGFAANTTLTLAGGTLTLPFDVTLAASVRVAANSTVSVGGCATATASGDWEWTTASRLLVSNVNETAGSAVCNGRLILSGEGTVENGAYKVTSILHKGGDLVFSGEACRWRFAAPCCIGLGTGGRYIGILDGAQVVFETLPEYGWQYLQGLTLGGNVSDKACLEVGSGSLLEFGEHRPLILGSANWHCVVTVKVSGGLLRFKGPQGSFQTGGHEAPSLTDTGSDRSPQVNIVVTDGGVIETDRVLAANPVTHRVDGGDFVAGVFLTLDGGTYKAGAGFGVSPQTPNVNARKSRNVLFCAVDKNNVDFPTAVLDYTAEIQVSVGPNGGTFDIADAQAGVTSVTNALVGAPVPSETIDGGFVPTRGPQWTLDGCLTVRGRGDQEFVVNGLDAAALKKLRADGVLVKVLSDSAATLDELTLGTPAGGLVVETAAAEPSGRDVSIAALTVADGGVFDASRFDTSRTTVQDLSFGAGATLYVRGNPVVRLPVTGTATLAADMGFFVAPGAPQAATVLSAAAVTAPAAGVSWTRRDGSRRRMFKVGPTTLDMTGDGIVLVVR